MTTSNVITDYLGAGLAAARPATPTLPSGTLGVWYSTDTGSLDVWDGTSWHSGAGTSGTIGVAKGGTGSTTLTAHAVLLGEGTGALGFATVGTAGRILTDTGASDPTFQVPPSRNVTSVTVSGSTQTLTPGITIGKYAITLQHNVTITMSGGTDGMIVLLELIQDSTGSRTVAFDSSVQFGTDITSFTATTTANAVDYVLLQYSADLSKWCFLSYSRGF